MLRVLDPAFRATLDALLVLNDAMRDLFCVTAEGNRVSASSTLATAVA